MLTMPRRWSEDYYDMRFPPYVSAAQRKRDAATAVANLKKKGLAVDPIAIEGRAIASTFWGKAWCTHLESLSDYRTRLPRGRSYVRSGAVVHLGLDAGRISAKVQGSALYDVEINVLKLPANRWQSVVARCTGSIDSLVELLRGKLSDSVMRTVTNVETGLFPHAKELRMTCSCPDYAGLCKHLAAVLYGVGARLDARPELLFSLRGVDPSELVAERAASTMPEATSGGKSDRRMLSSRGLSDIFGIELDLPAPNARVASLTPAKPTTHANQVEAEPASAAKPTSRGKKLKAKPASATKPTPRGEKVEAKPVSATKPIPRGKKVEAKPASATKPPSHGKKKKPNKRQQPSPARAR